MEVGGKESASPRDDSSMSPCASSQCTCLAEQERFRRRLDHPDCRLDGFWMPLVEAAGFEPATPCLQSLRTRGCALSTAYRRHSHGARKARRAPVTRLQAHPAPRRGVDDVGQRAVRRASAMIPFESRNLGDPSAHAAPALVFKTSYLRGPRRPLLRLFDLAIAWRRS
jgi:hypothetical protein